MHSLGHRPSFAAGTRKCDGPVAPCLPLRSRWPVCGIAVMRLESEGTAIGLQSVVPLRCEAHLLAPCAPQRRRSAVRARPHLPATGLTVGCGTLSKPLNEPIGGDRADG